MATREIPILGSGTKPDNSGNVFQAPYSIESTNGLWDYQPFIFKDSGTRIGLHGSFRVPPDYVGTAKAIVEWTSETNVGDAVFDLDYQAVGGDNAESLDQTPAQRSVSITDAAPGTDNYRMLATLTITDADLAAGDRVQFVLFRDGTDVLDDLLDSVTVHGLTFQYADT